MPRNRSSLSPLVNSAKAKKHSTSPAANAFPLAAGTLSGLFQKIVSSVNFPEIVNSPPTFTPAAQK
jgi:hypothetical protein